MKKNLIWIILGLLFIIGGVYWWQNKENKAEDEVIKIGVLAPLTGNSAAIGDWFKKGIEFAIEKNPKTKGVKIIFEDTKNDAKTAVAAYNNLKRQNVNAIFSTMSGTSFPIKPLAIKDNIPLFVTSVSNPDFPDGKTIFRYNTKTYMVKKEKICLQRNTWMNLLMKLLAAPLRYIR